MCQFYVIPSLGSVATLAEAQKQNQPAPTFNTKSTLVEAPFQLQSDPRDYQLFLQPDPVISDILGDFFTDANVSADVSQMTLVVQSANVQPVFEKDAVFHDMIEEFFSNSGIDASPAPQVQQNLGLNAQTQIQELVFGYKAQNQIQELPLLRSLQPYNQLDELNNQFNAQIINNQFGNQNPMYGQFNNQPNVDIMNNEFMAQFNGQTSNEFPQFDLSAFNQKFSAPTADSAFNQTFAAPTADAQHPSFVPYFMPPSPISDDSTQRTASATARNECTNCFTKSSPLWRKNANDQMVCNVHPPNTGMWNLRDNPPRTPPQIAPFELKSRLRLNEMP
jgi:hypothetical protein